MTVSSLSAYLGRGILVALLAFLTVQSSIAVAPVRLELSTANELGNSDVSEYSNVVIEANIVLISHKRQAGFIQDDGHGIHFALSSVLPLDTPLGTRVRMSGRLQKGLFRPYLYCTRIEVISRDEPIAPVPLTGEMFAELGSDALWVTFDGIVLDLADYPEGTFFYAIILWDDREIVLRVFKGASGKDYSVMEDFKKMRHRRVRVSAILATQTNQALQFTTRFFMLGDLEIIDAHPPIEIEAAQMMTWETQTSSPVTITGRVTRSDTQFAYIRSSTGSLSVHLPDGERLTRGDTVQFTGYPRRDVLNPTFLAHQVERIEAPATQLDLEPSALQRGQRGYPAAQNFDLLTIPCEIESIRGRSGETVLYCSTGMERFEAIIKKELPADSPIKVGCQVELTGICRLTSESPILTLITFADHFELLLTDFDDVVITRAAPWWNARRFITLVAIICAVVLLAIAWIAFLRVQVRRQAEQLSTQRARSSVLHERQRISREIHDSLQQSISGLSMQLGNLEVAMKSKHEENSERALGIARRMAKHCLREASSSVQELRDTGTTEGSLAVLLEDFVAERELHSDCRIVLHSKGLPFAIPDSASHHILSIAREATANALQHASPSRIEITFLYEDDESLTLMVVDDGVGFDVGAPPPFGHFGLVGMDERAKKLQGELSIQSSTNGTHLKFVVSREHLTTKTL